MTHLDYREQQHHLAIVMQQFPHVPSTEIRMLSGNEHVVYIVGDTTMFRFPQTRRPIEPHRKLALDALAVTGAVPFALPLFDIHVEESTDIWYERGRFLPGVALSPELARAMADHSLMKIARQMGTFLTAVHSIPIDRARSIGMDEMDPTDFWAYMEGNPLAWPAVRDRLLPLLPHDEQRWVEQLYARFIAQTKETPLPLVVRHSDMQTHHIIVDEETREVSGMIDFARRIADPAGDFKAFECYDKRFVDEVYAHYKLPIDPEFEDRRLFYTAHDAVLEVLRALDSRDDTAIQSRKASLSTYIALHQW